MRFKTKVPESQEKIDDFLLNFETHRQNTPLDDYYNLDIFYKNVLNALEDVNCVYSPNHLKKFNNINPV